MRGRSLELVFTPEDRAQATMQREIATALATGRSDDQRWHLRKDGSRFWASGDIVPLRNGIGEPTGLLKILRDRSEQREAELALLHSEMRTRLALEAADLGTWEAIPAIDVIHGDARARELLQHDPDEVFDYATHFLARIHPADRDTVDAHIRGALSAAGDGRVDAEYRILVEDGGERWIHSRAAVVKQAGERRRLVGTVRDITAEKTADAHRQLLSNELQHRVKNTLAVVQGIVSQSLRNVATPAEARDAIISRLVTLGRAHDVLTRTSWIAAPIAEIIGGATLAHGIRETRLALSGPPINLTARAALALSMVMHELCTNAIKYGALSNETGLVEIGWSVAGDPRDAILTVLWKESGGPEVSAPTRKGFGSRLIETSISSDLGKASLEFAPEGVRWRLNAQLSFVQEL